MKAKLQTPAPTELVVTSVSPVPVINLGNLRTAVAESLESSYGAQRVYGAALNSVLPRFWFDVEHTMTGETAKATKTEKLALYVVLKAAKHSNPSVIWGRIRNYGREAYQLTEAIARHATMTPEEIAAEKVAEEAEKATKNGGSPRSPLLRNTEELLALYNFNAKLEDIPAKVVEAQKGIVAALTSLGHKFL